MFADSKKLLALLYLAVCFMLAGIFTAPLSLLSIHSKQLTDFTGSLYAGEGSFLDDRLSVNYAQYGLRLMSLLKGRMEYDVALKHVRHAQTGVVLKVCNGVLGFGFGDDGLFDIACEGDLNLYGDVVLSKENDTLNGDFKVVPHNDTPARIRQAVTSKSGMVKFEIPFEL